MKTVLVSGASGIVGYGALRSLRKWGEVRLVGTSIYADSVAPGFSDIFELAPHTADDTYLEWLLAIIKRHKVDLLIPGIEADVYKWIDHIAELEGAGAIPLLNNVELIRTCRDKWIFYETLRTAHVACAIESSLESDYTTLAKRFGIPFIVKPRRSFGSKGVVKVGGLDAFERLRGDMGSQLMAQPLVGSDEEEYTISAFCDGKGGLHASMALRRKLSKEGFTEKAEVVPVDEFLKPISELCTLFKPVGPTNFQFRKCDDGLKLLEINPRISSSTSIRTAFGYNECTMAVEFVLYGRIPQPPAIRRGKAVRYTDEFIFYEDSLHF